MSRLMNSGNFLRHTVAPLLIHRGPINSMPVIGVDEGLNNEEHVYSLLVRLIQKGTIIKSIGLWYHIWETWSGKKEMIYGSPSDFLKTIRGISRQLRGQSTPDEEVIALLTSEFLSSDRIVLLTQNKANNRDGLRWILEREVAPALEDMDPKRLGLLVLCRTPKSNLN